MFCPCTVSRAIEKQTTAIKVFTSISFLFYVLLPDFSLHGHQEDVGLRERVPSPFPSPLPVLEGRTSRQIVQLPVERVSGRFSRTKQVRSRRHRGQQPLSE